MKERTPEQLKGQIRSFAGKRNLQSQEVLQMFLLERVLDRLSKSKYKDNFKGWTAYFLDDRNC